MSDTTTIRLRDDHGRFISPREDDIDGEVIEDAPGTGLAVRDPFEEWGRRRIELWDLRLERLLIEGDPDAVVAHVERLEGFGDGWREPGVVMQPRVFIGPEFDVARLLAELDTAVWQP